MKDTDPTDLEAAPRMISMPVGVVVRRTPGVTRWAKWAWRVTGVLPGAPQASWRVLRKEGDVTEFHAGTATLDLHRAETEGYRIALANRKKDPVYLFNSLHRQLGYPEAPRHALVVEEENPLPQLARRLEQLEKRMTLMEEEQRGGIDLTKLYQPPPGM